MDLLTIIKGNDTRKTVLADFLRWNGMKITLVIDGQEIKISDDVEIIIKTKTKSEEQSKEEQPKEKLPKKKKLVKRTEPIPEPKRIHRKLVQRKIETKKKPAEAKITPEIRQYFSAWENEGFKLPRKGSKRFSTSITFVKKIIKGTLFNNLSDFSEFHDTPISIQDFELSLKRFKKSATDIRYFPPNKQIMQRPINQFILSHGARTKVGTSMLLYFLKNEPRLKEGIIRDNYPKLTKKLISLYKTKILGDIKSGDLSPNEHQKFVEAAKNLEEFLSNNRDKIHPTFIATISDKANLLFNAIENDVQDSWVEINPGFFRSQTTFSRRLPAYLNKIKATKAKNSTAPNLSKQIG